MNKLDRQTWKYFVEQKVREIFAITLISFLVVLAPYFIAMDIVGSQEFVILTWFVGVFIIFFGILTCLTFMMVILGAGYAIRVWIESNWKSSKIRAKRSLK